MNPLTRFLNGRGVAAFHQISRNIVLFPTAQEGSFDSKSESPSFVFSKSSWTNLKFNAGRSDRQTVAEAEAGKEIGDEKTNKTRSVDDDDNKK